MYIAPILGVLVVPIVACIANFCFPHKKILNQIWELIVIILLQLRCDKKLDHETTYFGQEKALTSKVYHLSRKYLNTDDTE